jgi:integrase/recombinase XerD
MLSPRLARLALVGGRRDLVSRRRPPALGPLLPDQVADKRPSTIACHSNGPYAEERRQYLAACAKQGNSRSTLLFEARDLLWVARKLSVYPDLRRVTMEDIRALADDWRSRKRACGRALNTVFTRQRYVRLAAAWLRFLGHLKVPEEPIPFHGQLQAYCQWAREERGLTEATIKQFYSQITHFLRWYGVFGQNLADVQGRERGFVSGAR